MKFSLIAPLVVLGSLLIMACTNSTAKPQIPWNLKELYKAPAWQETSVVNPLGDQSWGYAGNLYTPELRARDRVNGDVKAIMYDGPVYQGKPTKVFAWIGIPKHKLGQKLPGIVLVHGGGGTAFESWVRLWNARGYAAIAMDNVGNIPGLGRNPDGAAGNCGDFGETNNPKTDQWTYQAVSSVILAHSLLRSLPDVDPDRTGITGVSWGGFLTCITAGLDQRFKCVIPIYGCGYLSEASAWIDRIKEQGDKGKEWCNLWDPSVYLPDVKAPIYWVAGTNDAAYWMRSLDKSYRLIKGKRSLSILGDMPHAHGGPGEVPLEISTIADYYLKNGPALPEFSKQKVRNNVLSADYTYSGKTKDFVLYYTTEKDINNTSKWNTLPVTDISKNRVSCKLPQDTTMAFINATIENDLRFSTDIFNLLVK